MSLFLYQLRAFSVGVGAGALLMFLSMSLASSCG